MNRKILLALILITAVSTLSTIMVKPTFAQTSIPTPYVPEFSVTYIASSYTVTSTNPDTGATLTNTYPNDTVQIMILNQAFNANALENGTTLSLIYNVREEGHFSDGNDWNALSDAPATNSLYTVISYDVNPYNGPNPPAWPQVTPGGQVDFQVQASIGYSTQVYPSWGGGFYSAAVWTGENSAWSETQTITITNGSTSTSISNSPYPTPPSPSPIPNTIAAYAAEGGSISPDGMVNVDSGHNQTFTITPDSEYQIADVKVNGVSVGAINTYTFVNVESSENITAAFMPIGGLIQTPTSTPMTIANSTVTPQNPMTGIQSKTEADFNWTQIALFIVMAVSVALVVAVIALVYRHRKNNNLSK